jgi:hypothetical protein
LRSFGVTRLYVEGLGHGDARKGQAPIEVAGQPFVVWAIEAQKVVRFRLVEQALCYFDCVLVVVIDLSVVVRVSPLFGERGPRTKPPLRSAN